MMSHFLDTHVLSLGEEELISGIKIKELKKTPLKAIVGIWVYWESDVKFELPDTNTNTLLPPVYIRRVV